MPVRLVPGFPIFQMIQRQRRKDETRPRHGKGGALERKGFPFPRNRSRFASSFWGSGEGLDL